MPQVIWWIVQAFPHVMTIQSLFSIMLPERQESYFICHLTFYGHSHYFLQPSQLPAETRGCSPFEFPYTPLNLKS